MKKPPLTKQDIIEILSEIVRTGEPREVIEAIEILCRMYGWFAPKKYEHNWSIPTDSDTEQSDWPRLWMN